MPPAPHPGPPHGRRAPRPFGALAWRSERNAPYNRRGYRISPRRRTPTSMANIFVCLFAVMLCLVNAVIWTFISEMPLMGIAWVGCAGFCLFLQKWSRG